MNDDIHKAGERGSALIGHMVAIWRRKLVEKFKIPAHEADDIAREMAHDCALDFGGQAFYLPKDIAFTLSKRDRELYDNFNGRNHHQLAKQYDLTVARVYQIVARVGEEERARKQGRLFDVPEVEK